MTKNAEVELLRAQVAALQAKLHKPPPALKLKVSPKGGISVYGLGRFPVTLYPEQWERLLNISDAIKEFIANHNSELSRKAA